MMIFQELLLFVVAYYFVVMVLLEFFYCKYTIFDCIYSIA